MTQDDVVVRPDDDDYDLLTVGEAGARLREEIMVYRKLVAEPGAEDLRAGREARLEALEAALTRHAGPQPAVRFSPVSELPSGVAEHAAV